MNKIINKLLSVTFPSANVEALMEVVESTSNPEVACEILCGLYIEPEMPKFVLSKRHTAGVLTFQKFDKWQDRVHYSYMRPETKSAYFADGTKKADITLENYDALKQAYKSGANQESISIETGVMETRADYMDSASWLEATSVGDPSQPPLI